LLALAALAVLPWFNIPLDNADGAGMLAHLQALFRDFDLLYDDDYEHFRVLPAFAYVTGEGVVSNHWPVGASFIQAPGYLAGRLVGALLGHDGHTIPLLGVRTWAMVLLLASAAGIQRWVGGRAGALSALAFVIGTPALYYAAEAPTRPHLYGAIAVLVAVWIWHDGADDTRRSRLVMLASVCGLATAIRPQLAPLCLLVAEFAWRNAPTAGMRIKRLVISGGAFLPWPLVILSMHVWMYGGDLVGYSGGEVTHHLRHFLTSPFHGVLPWCPVVLVGIFGLGLGAFGRRRGALLLLGLVVLQLWIDSGSRPVYPGHVLGSRSWSGGTAFGPRKLLDALPLLIPTAVWIREWAKSRTRRVAITGLTLAAIIPSALLHLAAFVDTSTTQRVLDWPAYGDALLAPVDSGVWSRAFSARVLPISVPLTMGVIVLLLCLAIGCGMWFVSRSAMPWRNSAVAVVASGMLALGWVSALQARSDAILIEDPDRMIEAAERMWGPHVRVLERATQYRAQLREKLGPGAAPP
jgi:hypothetical protein